MIWTKFRQSILFKGLASPTSVTRNLRSECDLSLLKLKGKDLLLGIHLIKILFYLQSKTYYLSQTCINHTNRKNNLQQWSSKCPVMMAAIAVLFQLPSNKKENGDAFSAEGFEVSKRCVIWCGSVIVYWFTITKCFVCSDCACVGVSAHNSLECF